ncbi:MAG TPA: hypothetical protein VFG83_19190 [Kofleriaceae bacterium]|nr:hypothetical protein [Kofleriaceae bacterium]
MTIRPFLSLVSAFGLALSGAACTGIGEASRTGPAGDPDPGAAYAVCPESPAPELFDHALCLCEDFAEVGQLVVGPGADGDAARVGINGAMSVVNQTIIDGSLFANLGINAVAELSVGDDTLTTGDATWVGDMSVGGDLAAGGDVGGVGYLSVGDTLRVAGTTSFLGGSDVTAKGPYSAPAGPPCGCDPATFFDVGAAVTAAADDNDNAAAGLPTSIASIGDTEVTLATGSYYFDGVTTVGRTRFVIDGAVALYIDGAIETVGQELFSLADGATLDLYVSGAVATVGQVVSDTGAGSQFRLYVGGDDPVLVSVGQQIFRGNIYAPTAQVAYVGDTTIDGALFARNLAGVGRLNINYASPDAPEGCTPPGDGGDDPGDTTPPDDGGDTPPGDGGGDDGDNGGDDGDTPPGGGCSPE